MTREVNSILVYCIAYTAHASILDHLSTTLPIAAAQSSVHISIASGSLLQSLHCLDRGVTGGSGGKGVHGRPVSISDGSTAGRSGRSGEMDPTCMVLPNAEAIEGACLEELRPNDSDRCDCCSESTCCS